MWKDSLPELENYCISGKHTNTKMTERMLKGVIILFVWCLDNCEHFVSYIILFSALCNYLTLQSYCPGLQSYCPGHGILCDCVSHSLLFNSHCTCVLLQPENPTIEDFIFGSSTTSDRSTRHPKFDPTGVRTHDLQIMTVHSMSPSRLL